MTKLELQAKKKIRRYDMIILWGVFRLMIQHNRRGTPAADNSKFE